MGDGIGSHAAHPDAVGQLDKGIVTVMVDGITVVPEFDKDAVTTKAIDETFQFASGCRRTLSAQRCGDQPRSIAGEYPCHSADLSAEAIQIVARRPLRSSEKTDRQTPCEAGVPSGPIGQKHHPIPRCGADRCETGDLSPEDGRHAQGAGCFGEANDTVETVTVGDRQRLKTQTSSFCYEGLGMRCPFEEREVGSSVKLGIGDPRRWRRPVRHRGLERLPTSAPRRGIATGVPCR